METKIIDKTVPLFKLFSKGECKDIGDDVWDWEVAFDCPQSWEECKDYYDATMLLFALNIKGEVNTNDTVIAHVSEFINENRNVFDHFMNEHNRDAYRPLTYGNNIAEDDELFCDVYMTTMESLIVGNYSEEDYHELFKMLTGKEMKDMLV